ncbi:MAG TPA: hypothetical protein VKV16_09725, partial [Solirubrobacteraceae bacterium]|nr:hypothetical protein [Solirubrobacteraceae bacterium]
MALAVAVLATWHGAALALAGKGEPRSARAALATHPASKRTAAKSTEKPPKKTQKPTVSGTLEDGQLLSAQPGEWRSVSPLSFSYQWQSCVKRACSPIPGATQSVYRLVTAQIGQSLEVSVTARNSAGEAIATSKRTHAVIPGPPVPV